MMEKNEDISIDLTKIRSMSAMSRIFNGYSKSIKKRKTFTLRRNAHWQKP